METTRLQCPVSLDSAKCHFPLRPKEDILSHTLHRTKRSGAEGKGLASLFQFLTCGPSEQRPLLGAPSQSGCVSGGLSRLRSASLPSRPHFPLPLPERRALSPKELESDHNTVPLHVTWQSPWLPPRRARAWPRCGPALWAHARWVSLPSGAVGVAGPVGVSDTKVWTFVLRPVDRTLLPLSKPIAGLSLGEMAPGYQTSPEARSPLRRVGRT